MSKKKRYGVIYKIENTVNGKCYIGQTTNKKGFNGRYKHAGKGIERVYKHHKYYKERNIHYNVHLLGAIEKYGFEAFNVIEEFDVAYSKQELNNLERKYIKEFDCINNGYNNKEGGSDGKHSEEVCKKISKKVKERWEDPEERRKISEKAKERWSDPDKRRKQSESLKGKYCGENHPNYGNHKLAGENHPMYGKHHTDEVRKKMSEKARERGKDPEYRMKQSEAMKGKFTGKNNPNARKVICLNDSKIFNTRKECAEYYKLSEVTIRKICKGITKKSRTGLKFMYYDEYLQQEQTA